MNRTDDVPATSRDYPAYNEDWHLVGIQLDPTHQLASPPRFSGHPGDDPKAFLYKLTLEVLTSQPFLRMDNPKDQLALEQKHIIFASSYLEGPALEWFFDLLARNAAEYIPQENVRRERLGKGDARSRRLEYDPEWPMVGITFPFVLDELSSFARWTKALKHRFRHLPGPAGPARPRAGSLVTAPSAHTTPGITPGPFATEGFKFRDFSPALGTAGAEEEEQGLEGGPR